MEVLVCQVSWNYVVCINFYFVNVNYIIICFLGWFEDE